MYGIEELVLLLVAFELCMAFYNGLQRSEAEHIRSSSVVIIARPVTTTRAPVYGENTKDRIGYRNNHSRLVWTLIRESVHALSSCGAGILSEASLSVTILVPVWRPPFDARRFDSQGGGGTETCARTHAYMHACVSTYVCVCACVHHKTRKEHVSLYVMAVREMNVPIATVSVVQHSTRRVMQRRTNDERWRGHRLMMGIRAARVCAIVANAPTNAATFHCRWSRALWVQRSK